MDTVKTVLVVTSTPSSNLSQKSQKKMLTDKPTLCQHGKDHSLEDEHTCPFAEDVHNDKDSICNCCDECTKDCSDDI